VGSPESPASGQISRNRQKEAVQPLATSKKRFAASRRFSGVVLQTRPSLGHDFSETDRNAESGAIHNG